MFKRALRFEVFRDSATTENMVVRLAVQLFALHTSAFACLCFYPLVLGTSSCRLW